jgi:hypothetical protein
VGWRSPSISRELEANARGCEGADQAVHPFAPLAPAALVGCHGCDDSELWLVTFAQGRFGDRQVAVPSLGLPAWAVKAGGLSGGGFNYCPLVPAPALREDRMQGM